MNNKRPDVPVIALQHTTIIRDNLEDIREKMEFMSLSPAFKDWVDNKLAVALTELWSLEKEI